MSKKKGFSVKAWIFPKSASSHISALLSKITDLEERLAKLEIPEKNPKDIDITQNEAPPSVHIENLRVDKIIVEKLDYTNNLGQLGIKELTGRLNIGTSYEGTEKVEKKVAKKMKDLEKAKVNFRSKPEKG